MLRRTSLWLAGVLWLGVCACGALDTGGTDGESSFLDGKRKPIGTKSAEPVLSVTAVPSSADAAASITSDATSSNEATTTAETANTSEKVDPIYIGEWTTVMAPASCVEGLSTPIAGCDPTVDTTWDLDCDGDGIPDHVAYDCDPANTEVGYPFYGRYDCAPADPTRALWIAADFDADTFLGDGEFNCSGFTLPEGYVTTPEGSPGQDCNDERADIYPGASDLWGDAVDSDCTGYDAPNCDIIEAEGYHPPPLNDTSSCEFGADLHVAEGTRCLTGDCLGFSGRFYFIVTNTGDVASPEDTLVRYTDVSGQSHEVLLKVIAPGETSPLIVVPFSSQGDITVTIEREDCTPDDNTLVTQLRHRCAI